MLLLKEGSNTGDVCFITDRSLKSEAYRLDVTSDKIVINASDVKGFFYALQTIRMLLPASIENARNVGGDVDWAIPSVSRVIIGCCPFFYTQKECIAHHRLYGNAENK